MGFFGLFSDKPTTNTIEKLVGRVKERYAQPEYRREAMDKLLAFETPEAVTALLQRFTVVVTSPHWDETEKRWLVDELVARPEVARAPLIEFLATSDSVAFAAQALLRMTTTKDRFVDDLRQALQARPPSDHRTTQGKTELVAVLAEQTEGRVLVDLVPYLHDHADDVQMATLDAVLLLWAVAAAEHQTQAHSALQVMVSDDTRSARVLRHGASLMAKLQLTVDANKPLPAAVAEDFVVKDGRLSKS
jgi:hypothetical protein